MQIACRTASSAARPQRASRGLATFNWVTTVDVVLPNTTNAKSRGGKNYRFRSGRLAPEHVEIVDNVSVTSRIACLFDICRYHGRLACLVALESARNTWPELTVVTLLEMSRGLPRAKGLRLFRQVIEASVGTSESALETVVRDLVVRIPGVTSVRGQVTFTYRSLLNDDPRTGRIDLVVNDIIAIECDGRVFHSDDIRADERRREKQLLNRGMIVLPVGWTEVRAGEIQPLEERALRNVGDAQRLSA